MYAHAVHAGGSTSVCILEIERMALKKYDEEGNLIYEIPDDEPLHTRMMYFDLKKV